MMRVRCLLRIGLSATAATSLLLSAASAQPANPGMPQLGKPVTGPVELKPLPSCEAKDVLVSNAVPGKGGEASRMIICRRDYTQPVSEVFNHYRQDLEAAGFRVVVDKVDATTVHLNAKRAASSLEVFARKGTSSDIPFVEVIYQFGP
jgi:hypothetical protein